MDAAALSQVSNQLVYSAIAVYTLAMVAFAADLARRSGGGGLVRASIRATPAPAPIRTRATPVPAPTRTGAQPLPAPTRTGAQPLPGRLAVSGSAPVVSRRGVGLSLPSQVVRRSLDSTSPRSGGAVGARLGGRGADRPRGGPGGIGMSLTWLAAGLLAGGLALRGLAAGRAPWGNMYEFSLATALTVSLAFLLVQLRRPEIRPLGAVVAPLVLLDLGLAITVLYVDPSGLVPSLKSYWLLIHVAAAIVCSGTFAVGAVLNLGYLLQVRLRRLGSRLPAPERLEVLAFRVHAFVFPLWTFAIVAGAIWAESAWGRYWGWDPKETWAFITWVVYAAYLHARATAGWRGPRAAAIALVGFGCLLFNYFGVNLWFVGLHSYAGVG